MDEALASSRREPSEKPELAEVPPFSFNILNVVFGTVVCDG
jgi:hypothetical protein